jgi:hypothetical protein
MVASLRRVFSALNRRGTVSLCRDIQGFSHGRVPAALNAGRPRSQININQFVRLLRGEHFHVQLIITGSDLLSENDTRVLDYDVFRLRDIYATVEIGIGIVSRDLRTTQNSGGHAVVRTGDDVLTTGHDYCRWRFCTCCYSRRHECNCSKSGRYCNDCFGLIAYLRAMFSSNAQRHELVSRGF